MATHDQLLESLHILDLDVTPGNCHQALIAQMGDAATNGFQAQTQVGADFLAAHLQDKVRSRITTGVQAL